MHAIRLTTGAVLLLLTTCCLLPTGSIAQTPGIINYQGRVVVNGTNFDGTGQFKFALVDGGTNIARQATAIAYLAGGFVVSNTVTDGGYGYLTAPAVTDSGGGGSGATLHALVGGGAVTGLVQDSAGSGYSTPPTVLIDLPSVTMSYRTFWSNGTTAVSVPVSKGLCSVLLGDTNIPNMTYAVPASVFTNADVRLRVWFNSGSGWQQFSPDQRLAAVGYALMAAGANAAGLVGTVSDASLSANVARLNATNQVFASAVTFSNVNGTFSGNGAALTNLTVTWAVGAGLVDSNTFFISSTAPAGGDGSMAQPWNSLYALTNNGPGRMNGKTVIILAGVYLTGTDIIFNSTYSNLTVKGLDQQNVRIVSTNNSYRIFSCIGGLTNIVFDGMTLTSRCPYDGGAVLLQAGCTVQNCTFIACHTTGSCGGAVECYNGGTVQNCTFVSNSSASTGGGVDCSGVGAMIINCTFSGNTADTGGGLYCGTGDLAQNCTFSGNTANSGGGGVFCADAGMVQNCTFSGNTASSGGGVFCADAGTVQNCTIIRGAGATNSVFTYGSGAKWMCVWTNDTSAAGFVTFASSLNN